MERESRARIRAGRPRAHSLRRSRRSITANFRSHIQTRGAYHEGKPDAKSRYDKLPARWLIVQRSTVFHGGTKGGAAQCRCAETRERVTAEHQHRAPPQQDVTRSARFCSRTQSCATEPAITGKVHVRSSGPPSITCLRAADRTKTTRKARGAVNLNRRESTRASHGAR